MYSIYNYSSDRCVFHFSHSATQEELDACGLAQPGDSTDLVSQDADTTDETYTPPPSTSTSEQSDYITLKLPRKSLMRESAELATRCRVSHRVATAMTAKLVKIGGGQLNQCSISTTTSHRHRSTELKCSEAKIKSKFKNMMPKFIVLHWDGKVIKYENRQEQDERLAIVASFPRPAQQHQFLAAPCIPNGTGATMCNALLNTLQSWQIPHENIIGISWDTTASNTGSRQGSASLFERELEQAVLWLACRHHIGELHIKHADIQVRGAWNGKLRYLLYKFTVRHLNIQLKQ